MAVMLSNKLFDTLVRNLSMFESTSSYQKHALSLIAPFSLCIDSSYCICLRSERNLSSFIQMWI